MSLASVDSTSADELRGRAVQRLLGTTATPGVREDAAAALAVIHDLASSGATAPDALALLHELQVHQVEIDLQDEELRRALRELEITLHRQTQLYDYSPVACLSVDREGVVCGVNRLGAALLGFDAELLRGRLLDGFLTAAGGRRLHEMLGRVSQSGAAQSAELELSGLLSAPQRVWATACPDPAGSGYLLAVTPAGRGGPPV